MPLNRHERRAQAAAKRGKGGERAHRTLANIEALTAARKREEQRAQAGA